MAVVVSIVDVADDDVTETGWNSDGSISDETEGPRSRDEATVKVSLVRVSI